MKRILIITMLAFAMSYLALGQTKGGKANPNSQDKAKSSNPHIYIVDNGNDRIVSMDDMTGKGWTTYGTSGAPLLGNNVPGQFGSPISVFVNKKRIIYVLDYFTRRIVRMDDMTGKNWEMLSFTSRESDVVDFFLDEADHIYVFTDSNGIGGNFYCQIIRIDDLENRFRGGTKNGVKQFSATGLFIDGEGRIYVADAGNHRIARMDDMTGKNWITIGGEEETGAKQFGTPVSVWVDRKGRIYVTDQTNNCILRMDDMTGKNWLSFGTKGGGVNQFHRPTDICLDEKERIYVVDNNNNRIVRIDDMTGKNWISFGSKGDGVGQFGSLGGIFVR